MATKLTLMLMMILSCPIINDIILNFVNGEPYVVKTQGFLKVLNRSEATILFRTPTGIQMLTGNNTCIDNKNSVYYTVNKKITYFSYSSVENYMMMITEDNQICTRNLYKTDWNNALRRDIRRECHITNFKDSEFYGLSINHHVIFSITNNKLHFFSMTSPMCGGDISSNEFHGVKFLHVTNFLPVSGQDSIFITYADMLEEYTPAGELINRVMLANVSSEDYHANETLKSFDSDDVSDEINCFFMFIQQDRDAIIRRFTNSITNTNQIIFRAVNRTALSFDVSTGMMAILTREAFYDDNGNKIGDGKYFLQIRGSNPIYDNEPFLNYTCNPDDDNEIQEVIMLNQRKQQKINYCDVNMQACESLGRNKMCDYLVVLDAPEIFKLDEQQVADELQWKMLFTGIFAFMSFLFILCYTIAEKMWLI